MQLHAPPGAAPQSGAHAPTAAAPACGQRRAETRGTEPGAGTPPEPGSASHARNEAEFSRLLQLRKKTLAEGRALKGSAKFLAHGKRQPRSSPRPLRFFLPAQSFPTRGLRELARPEAWSRGLRAFKRKAKRRRHSPRRARSQAHAGHKGSSRAAEPTPPAGTQDSPSVHMSGTIDSNRCSRRSFTKRALIAPACSRHMAADP